jgi:DNA repair protein RecO (recombination protein O)
MYRSVSTDALVLRRERFGEFHKSLLLLTADLGLVNATAYGAYKMHSRLRLGSEPFTFSRVQLYHNPVRKSYKVTELEIKETFSGLQSDVGRIAAASLWVEVTQRSFAAGEVSDQLLRLFRDCLRLLDASDARRRPYLTLQFLWRFLSLSGYQPRIDACDSCSRPLPAGEGGWYSPSSNAMLCRQCSHAGCDPLTAGGLRYLEASGRLSVAEASEIRLESESLAALVRALPRMVQAVLEGELTSLRYVEVGA